ncbi:QsdR family transcriptional regulator [Solimonas marina]|uniref:Transcriptional regulator n=1 Tax=Solimonas marina TaxID=2714601 RepID=A0A970B928_9GAMM|nr:QsdR family transcriptional regulator [Solimonas marina]NKF22884.1 transcriptional regulator [Solimonas marina]
MALQKWLAGERIEVAALATELGVGRATLFRWIGSRELLVGEVLWVLLSNVWARATRDSRGSLADYAADVSYRVMSEVLAFEPFRRFLDQDPEYALRVLMSKDSPVQSRIIAEVRKVVCEHVEVNRVRLMLDIDDLAYILVRIVESCMYSDQIAGRKPKLEAARDAIRILVSAQVPSLPLRRARSKTDQGRTRG